jgi:hypothetical protein
MSRPTKSNVPQEALRWRIDRAGIEFGLTSATLRKSLARSSAAPDAGGLYTTRQVVDAIHGTLHIEKTRTQRARARKLELENAITTGSVLNRDALMQGMSVSKRSFGRLARLSILSSTSSTRQPQRSESWRTLLRFARPPRSSGRRRDTRTVQHTSVNLSCDRLTQLVDQELLNIGLGLSYQLFADI